MDNDTCAGFNYRITKIQHNHPQHTLTVGKQEEEPSGFLSTVTTQDSKDIVFPSEKQEDPVFKKVKCSTSCHEDNSESNINLTEDKQELGLSCFVSGSEENKEMLGSGSEKVTSSDSPTGFVADVEKKPNEVEKDHFGGLARKEEHDFVEVVSGIQEFDKFNEEKDYEARKKRFLDKLEVGTIFGNKTLMEIRHKGYRKIEGLKAIDGSVRPSLKIEVIDDTALIESFRVPKTKIVKHIGTSKVTERTLKEEKKQQVNGKKAKRSTRNAKDTRKVLVKGERLKNLTQIVQDGGLKNAEPAKIKYSREEMVALRFVNTVAQRKMWTDVYTGLGPVVVSEYHDLSSLKHHKHILLNFDPRKRFSSKSEAPRFHGVVAASGRRNHFNIFVH